MTKGSDSSASFATPQQFWDWLHQNHATEPEIWLKIFKKSSNIPSVDWEQAVVVALAWGWIDGQKKSCDETAYLQRFTPRTKKSGWSKKNRDHAEKLILQGQMQEPGLAAVERAKVSGQWDAAYAGSSNMEIPADFLQALSGNEQAQAFYNTLDRANLFSIYYRLQSAKKPQTRQDRMRKIIDRLSRGEKFH